jgi:hypothetical protein
MNSEAVKPDASKNWLSEATKVRHLTLITTFSEKKISIYRLFDIGINQIVVATHILKAQPGNDALQSMADDMSIKEPMGLVYSDVKSVGIQPWSLSSAYETINFTDKADFDKTKYSRVMNMRESNSHPFNIDLDFDIFFEHTDEPLVLLTQ